MDTINKNSHIVYFRRAPLFATEARKELEEYFSNSSRSIGSYFTKGSTRTATGLTIGEENLLMPFILSIDSTDRDFRAQVNDWFRNLDTKVPAGDGIPLEIGLETSNSEPVSKDNLPLNVEHYIRVKHGIGHPQVAASPELAKGNQLKQYYLYDPQAVSRTSINVNDEKDKALAQYLTIKTNARSVRMYLTLLGVNPLTVKNGEESVKLRQLVEEKPTTFLEIVADKFKEVKYVVQDMINNKVLELHGDAILTKDGSTIGRNMKEAVSYLSDARNSKVFASLKALLQEAWKRTSQSVDTLEDLDEQPLAAAETTEEAPAPEVVPDIMKDDTPAAKSEPAQAADTAAPVVEGSLDQVE